MSIDAGRYLDLAGVIVLALLPLGLIPVVGNGELRFVITLPLLLFAPGYAIVAAFYPESGTSDSDGGLVGGAPGETVAIGPIGRLGLSVATSVAAVSLVTLALNFLTGIRAFPILVGLLALTVAAALLAAVRRRMLPADVEAGIHPLDRFRDGVQRYFVAGGQSFSAPRPFEAESRRGVGLNALMVVSVLVLCSSVGFAFVMGPQEDPFAELYVETSQNGNTTIPDPSAGLTESQIRSLQFVVDHHGDQPQTYTAVAQVRTGGGEVLEQSQFTQRVAPEEQWRQPLDVTPRFGSARLYIQLYRGDDTSGQSAYTLERIPLTPATQTATPTNDTTPDDDNDTVTADDNGTDTNGTVGVDNDTDLGNGTDSDNGTEFDNDTGFGDAGDANGTSEFGGANESENDTSVFGDGDNGSDDTFDFGDDAENETSEFGDGNGTEFDNASRSLGPSVDGVDRRGERR